MSRRRVREADLWPGLWRVARDFEPLDERVPADPSAAAFWLVAGAIHPDAELTLRAVGVNPTRRAAIDILVRMGARIEETASTARQRPTAAAAGDEPASRWRT